MDQRITMEVFEEDWQHSQFWYSDDTAYTLGTEMIRGIEEEKEDVYVAIVAAPSAFVKLMEDRVLNLSPGCLNCQLISSRAHSRAISSYTYLSSTDDSMSSRSSSSSTILKNRSTSLRNWRASLVGFSLIHHSWARIAKPRVNNASCHLLNLL